VRISPHVTAEMVERLHRDAGEAGVQRAKALLEAANIRCQAHIVLGDPAGCIAAYATETRCDEIIMGTRGMGAVGNLVLGSVARKVVHLAAVPVTLVK